MPLTKRGRDFLSGAAVLSAPLFGVLILYLVTALLLWWRNDYCHSPASGPDKAVCALATMNPAVRR